MRLRREVHIHLKITQKKKLPSSEVTECHNNAFVWQSQYSRVFKIVYSLQIYLADVSLDNMLIIALVAALGVERTAEIMALNGWGLFGRPSIEPAKAYIIG